MSAREEQLSPLDRWLGRKKPVDPTYWHHWILVFPRRAIDGSIAMGDVWRRWDAGRWDYENRYDLNHDNEGIR